MGLLDTIKGLFGQQDTRQACAELGAQALHSALGDSRFGDVNGLLQHLSAAGLGGHVASWLDPQAPNQPVSSEQITHALGGGELGTIASSLGISQEAASQFIAQHLPKLAACGPGGQGRPPLH